MKRAALVWTIFTGFAALACYEALKLPFGTVNAPRSGFFPAVLAALLALISLGGLLAAAVNGGGSRSEAAAPLFWRKILLTVGLLVAFAASFEFLGYVLSSFLFVFSVLRGVERTSWRRAGGVAVSAALISYLLFGLLLGTPLPSGFLRI
jgi:putative tricarboxylic transport membrane protein